MAISINPIGKVKINSHRKPPPPELSLNIDPPFSSEYKKAPMIGTTATNSPARTRDDFFQKKMTTKLTLKITRKRIKNIARKPLALESPVVSRVVTRVENWRYIKYIRMALITPAQMRAIVLGRLVQDWVIAEEYA